ncbi:MAG: hypothetical protein CVU42_01045 [Chloroflexi bacterium HGW-Chloroflexi-4]|jgi:hypothetical protein|nr:MAG: hypothetical protein CVU42_01045 [Chloroflexi bacterium HGW-Chloroflexi-4]
MIYKKLLNYSKWIWSAAVLAAVVYYLLKNWRIVSSYFVTLNEINLLCAVILLFCGKLALVLLSKNAVAAEGLNLSYKKMFTIVSITQLGKYIPGGVWHFVGRYNMYHEHDLSLKKSTKSLITENFWMLTGAISSGLIFACFSPYFPGVLLKLGINIPSEILTLCGILIIFSWFGVMVFFDRLFRLKGQQQKIGSLVSLLFAQFLCWSCFGLSFALIFQNLVINGLSMTISYYSLGWIVGFVAVFAPGGIGIREAALVWLFSNFYPAQEILVYSTVHRFIFFVVEIILGIIAWRLNAGETKYSYKTDNPSEK